ncbi:MAG: family N-acetyltransferase [Rickettsiaceae bacterium]|jgi:L-amino acid N-acyltransferase YncA|nr:family N-acetyltransferase [Rickettsiaceae bacterium]
MSEEITIELASAGDFQAIWKIFKQVIKTGDTYVNRPETTRKEAKQKWLDKNAKTFVAKYKDKIVGAYLIRHNQVDLGSHIANCSYIVDQKTRGIGIGKTLGNHSIQTAKSLGYKAIQFNFVVSTNEAAVNLWQSLGFRIIGTIPGGFNHQKLGFVDAYIMFREL